MRKGESLAIVGESGSGKSTLARLLFRLYEIEYGSIKIYDFDVKNVTQNSLRKFIGIVPQDTVLFNSTILFNLTYGSYYLTKWEELGKEKEKDQKEGLYNVILNACKKAHIFEFINNLNDKFDTLVGEKGFKLSGGEKQRISLARSLIQDAQIIVFDEATSSLDSIAENVIQNSL